ncbi:class F sortase [Streptomyces sp. Ru71]|uniref:class F sortase n=1 Tax=Streptomyces sp. Ru71 TaxID=2080746 RepID=UPI0035BC38F1
MTVVLVTVGVRCSGHDQSAAPQRAGGPDVAAVAGVPPARADAPDGDRDDAAPTRPGGSPTPARPGGPTATRPGGSVTSAGPGSSATPARPGGTPAATGPGGTPTAAAPGVGPTAARPSPKVARVRARPTPPNGPLPRSRPTTFRIPSLGIDAPVVGLRLNKDRELRTPPVDRPRLVGWYQGGATPGEPGTAIAVGHRDTTKGPAVFAGLALVKPGKTIEVERADGRTAVYTVDRVRVFDKSGFPDKEVYGPSRRPELRVITCGGLFSRRTGYTSNVVVFAHLTGVR